MGQALERGKIWHDQHKVSRCRNERYQQYIRES